MILQLNISEQLGQKFQAARSQYHLSDDAVVEGLLAGFLEDAEDYEAILASEKNQPELISAANLRAELGL